MKFIAEPQVFRHCPNGGLGMVHKFYSGLAKLIPHLVGAGSHGITAKKRVAEGSFGDMGCLGQFPGRTDLLAVGDHIADGGAENIPGNLMMSAGIQLPEQKLAEGGNFFFPLVGFQRKGFGYSVKEKTYFLTALAGDFFRKEIIRRLFLGTILRGIRGIREDWDSFSLIWWRRREIPVIFSWKKMDISFLFLGMD